MNLIVRNVQESIDKGRVKEEKGIYASRNALQTVTLLDSITELKIDAAIGGARRDEEKARAKERFFLIVMNSDNGIQKIKGRNCGICTMEESSRENIFASFLSATGQSWMCGIMCRRRK